MIGTFNFFALLSTAFSDYVLPLLFTLGLVVFLWGVFQYRIRAYDEEAKEEGKALMFYGLLAVVLMVVIWGFVHIAANAVRP